MQMKCATDFSKTCFVIAPIGSSGTELYERFRGVLDFAIKPAVELANLDLKVVRADDIGDPGSLIRDILEHLAGSYIVIADLSGQNPNVFYELGVRHSLSPRTILIAHTVDDIPFDLRDYRIIPYDQKLTPAGVADLTQRLKQYLLQIQQNPTRADSPVLDRLGTSKLVQIPSSDLASELRVPLDIRHSGLFRVYKTFPVDDVYRAISQARRRVFILTTWLHQVVRLAPALGAAAKNGAEVKVLLLDPDSEAARQRSRDLGYADHEYVSSNVKNSITELRTHLSREEVAVTPFKIYTYDLYPTFHMYCMDEVMLHATALKRHVSMNGPQLEIRGEDTLLFKTYVTQFNYFLDSAQELEAPNPAPNGWRRR